MSENNEFAETLSALSDSLTSLMSRWTDETAKTYEPINENVENLTSKINSHFNNSKQLHELLKKNYNEEDLDSLIQMLASKVEQV